MANRQTPTGVRRNTPKRNVPTLGDDFGESFGGKEAKGSIVITRETLQNLEMFNKSLIRMTNVYNPKNQVKDLKQMKSLRIKTMLEEYELQKKQAELSKKINKSLEKVAKASGRSTQEVAKEMKIGSKDFEKFIPPALLKQMQGDIIKSLPKEMQDMIKNRVGGSDASIYNKLKGGLESTTSKFKDQELVSVMGAIKKAEGTISAENYLLSMNNQSLGKKENVFKAKMEEIAEKFKEGILKNEDFVKVSLLGPLSLLVQPLEDFFGSSFIKGSFDLIDKFKNKTRPSAKDVAKTGDMGSLFIWNKIKHYFEKDRSNGEGGFGSLKDFLSGKNIGPIASAVMKAGGLAAIAGGLIWMAIDGIMGAMKSGKWGVDKVSGFIGGFLGGTGAGGFSDAFKNMGKWALLGAGIGLTAAGPIGALAGGLIGAAIGFVLGYIGGENIAKGFDSAKKQFTDLWTSDAPIVSKLLDSVKLFMENAYKGIGAFIGAIPDMIVTFITKDKAKGKEAGKIARTIYATIFDWSPAGFLSRLFGNMAGAFKEFKDTKGQRNVVLRVGKLIWELFINGMNALIQPALKKIGVSGISSGIVKLGGVISKFITDAVSSGLSNIKEKVIDIKQFVTDVWNTAVNWVKTKFTSLMNTFNKGGAGQLFEDFSKVLTNLISGLISTVTNIFTYLGDYIGYLWGFVSAGKFDKAIGFITGFDNKGFTKYQEEQSKKRETKVNDAIIRTDGSIIHTDPRDTIVATKNDPYAIRSSFTRGSSAKTTGTTVTVGSGKESSLEFNSTSMETKLDTMIDLLKELLKKEPKINLPRQSSGDLDKIMSGVLL